MATGGWVAIMEKKWTFEQQQNLKRVYSSCVAQTKNAQSYPTSTNKAHVGDLWAIVSAISEDNESAAD